MAQDNGSVDEDDWETKTFKKELDGYIEDNFGFTDESIIQMTNENKEKIDCYMQAMGGCPQQIRDYSDLELEVYKIYKANEEGMYYVFFIAYNGYQKYVDYIKITNYCEFCEKISFE